MDVGKIIEKKRNAAFIILKLYPKKITRVQYTPKQIRPIAETRSIFESSTLAVSVKASKPKRMDVTAGIV